MGKMNIMEKESLDDTINSLMSHYFKSKRLECGLSGKQLGELLCISQQHISRYERGETAIPLSLMVFFLNLYAFNLNDFFDYLLDGINSRYKTESHKNHMLLNKKILFCTEI